MITRGFYIGEIVDEFSAIGAQVQMRNRLGFTDLSVFCENFFRDVLNCLLEASLRNLNAERSNEPGLDLGDATKRIAFQVTSAASSKKVNDTLAKITSKQKTEYQQIVILAICGRQTSYSIDETLSLTFDFSEKNIWDMNTLARKALDLEIDRLESLHRLVKANVVKVRVELEVPDENGVYPTTSYSQWETRIKPSVGDGLNFAKFLAKEAGVELEELGPEGPMEALAALGHQLSRLPRVTREFLVVLLERREPKNSRRFRSDWAHVLYDKVIREFRGSDIEGELRILEHENLIRINGENQADDGPAEIGLCLGNVKEPFTLSFLKFIAVNNLDLRRVVGEGDLSSF